MSTRWKRQRSLSLDGVSSGCWLQMAVKCCFGGIKAYLKREQRPGLAFMLLGIIRSL